MVFSKFFMWCFRDDGVIMILSKLSALSTCTNNMFEHFRWSQKANEDIWYRRKVNGLYSVRSIENGQSIESGRIAELSF